MERCIEEVRKNSVVPWDGGVFFWKRKKWGRGEVGLGAVDVLLLFFFFLLFGLLD